MQIWFQIQKKELHFQIVKTNSQKTLTNLLAVKKITRYFTFGLKVDINTFIHD